MTFTPPNAGSKKVYKALLWEWRAFKFKKSYPSFRLLLWWPLLPLVHHADHPVLLFATTWRQSCKLLTSPAHSPVLTSFNIDLQITVALKPTPISTFPSKPSVTMLSSLSTLRKYKGVKYSSALLLALRVKRLIGSWSHSRSTIPRIPRIGPKPTNGIVLCS